MNRFRKMFHIGALLLALLLGFPIHAGAGNSSGARLSEESAGLDWISLKTSARVKTNPLADLGLLDVTALPFGADPAGRKDSTKAIQDAVNFARDNQMVCFFPEGDYLISDTIKCEQKPIVLDNGRKAGATFFPNVLMGSVKGRLPRLILADRAKGFGNYRRPKCVIHFFAQHLKRKGQAQPNISYNQVIMNLEIVIGEGNSGAVGVRHRAAQGSAIENLVVDATHGYCGIEGGIGSGGSIAKVVVKGGRIGMSLVQTQPVPTITGITLKGQTETPLVYGGRQSLSAVGLRIETSCSGPALSVTPRWDTPHNGEVSLVDSSIEFSGGSRIGVKTARGLYMRNVYMGGVKRAVEHWDGVDITVDPSGWVHFEEYAATGKPYRPYKGFIYRQVLVVDQNELDKPVSEYAVSGPPPADLQSRHIWPDTAPSFEAEGAVNVKKAPYAARGDGLHDDTQAIQRAINEHEIVFIPKGVYQITRPLRLRKNSKLVGVAKHLSVIWVDKESHAFSPNNPQAAIQTVDAADADVYLAFMGIYTPVDFAGASALEWRCGGRSIVRDVNFILEYTKKWRRGGKPQKSDFVPNVYITGNGGGKWYNFYQGRVRKGKNYRHLLVENVDGPLSFYHLNVEHARGDAAAEVRNSRGVSVFGLKGESWLANEDATDILRITDSVDVSVYGYGGNAATKVGHAIFHIIDSENVRIVNGVDTPQLNIKRRPNPDQWHMIISEKSGHQFMLPPLDRPIFYHQR